ncbi:FUSC family protein [Gordonia sp. NB41Y]|uniref:FUSC family protein n=1 Tax=Gordonia sp. NB41Y TaxID=875808 RepID=UPI00273CB259|nr:FUSC family protein [Gordonia sp. NB41Y]WLP90601.1 FUSC family protein [Gordonia sp. NB41Y]
MGGRPTAVGPGTQRAVMIASSMSVSMILGVLVAPYRWATLPLIVGMVLLTTVIYYAFMLTRGPGPLHLFYAATLGAFFGADQTLGWQIVHVIAFATFFTGLLTVLILLVGLGHPERDAVAAAREKVDAYRDGTASRTDAYRAVNRAWVTLQSAWPATGGAAHRAREKELLAINRTLAVTVLAAAGDRAPVRDLAPDTPILVGRPGFRFLLAHAVRPNSVAWFTAWRMAIAAGAAGLISEIAGIGHPYWAVLTATIVLHQWIDRRATTRRAAQRAVGTILGLGIVAVVTWIDPGPWTVIVVVIVCVIAMDLLLPLNYAVALIFVTPMSLLSIEATGQGGSLGSLLGDRLYDTLIGAAVAVVVTWATSRWFPARLLRAQSRRVEAATVAVETMTDEQAVGESGRRARAELVYELLHHLGVVERAAGDDPRLDARTLAEHDLLDRGYLALARVWCEPRLTT